jgi:hypothetical protein
LLLAAFHSISLDFRYQFSREGLNNIIFPVCIVRCILLSALHTLLKLRLSVRGNDKPEMTLQLISFDGHLSQYSEAVRLLFPIVASSSNKHKKFTFSNVANSEQEE